MIFVCEKSHLEPAVQITARAVNPRSPLPVLSHILMQARQGNLRLAATDLEMSVDCSVTAEVTQEGACTLPAKVLCEVVSQLPDRPVGVQLLGPTVEFRARNTVFRVNAMSWEEYPSLPQAREETAIIMPQRLLRSAFRRVSVACASEEETRAVLQGVQMTLSEGIATFVATDGRRLAKTELALEGTGSESFNVIIPGRATSELQRVLKDSNEPLKMSIQENQIFFILGSMVVSSRLLDGKFPNYRNLLPTRFNTVVRADRELFASAVRRTLVMAQERISPRLVKLEIQGEDMRVMANAPDVGAAEDRLPVVREGTDLEIAFNGKFLLDGLNIVGEGEVTFQLNDPESAGLIRPGDNSNFLYLIMPVRIQKEEPVPVGAGAANN